MSREFINDVAAQPQADRLRALRGALLVLHSPDDDVVGVENARSIFDQARHPKSFVSLDGADHLLSHREDSHFAASMIAAWAERHLPAAQEDAPVPVVAVDPASPVVTVREQSDEGMVHRARTGRHSWLIDEPLSAGRRRPGRHPLDILLRRWGVHLYDHAHVRAPQGLGLRARHRDVATPAGPRRDCATCETTQGMVDQIDREITLDPSLSADQRQALLAIADKCPVHRALTREVLVTTRLADDTSARNPGGDLTIELAAS